MRRISREWLDYARMDLDSAEFLLNMRPIPVEIICYHCHQSAEKALKGVLAEHDMEPPKTHDLTRLCGMCEGFAPAFSELSGTCQGLAPFASKLRYPDAPEVTVEMMNATLKGSHTVLDFVLSVLKEGTES